MVPFGLKTPWQFRSSPPPSLLSKRYTADYLEVKSVGRIDSLFRTQEQTDVARFYAATLPIQLWCPVARQASSAGGLTLSENARMFALLMMAICDASIAVFESKYYYNMWRPVTAIRAAALDGNPATAPDSDWLPLVGTPPYPTYPSAHAGLSGAARQILERFFGKKNHSLTVFNVALPDIALDYSDFRQICDDIDEARIYGGIHFRFDQEAGVELGTRVGRYILSHYLKPIGD